MQYYRLVAIFVITVLTASVLYPLSARASNDASDKSNKEKHVVSESHSDDNKHEENHGEDKKPQEQNSSQNSSNTNIPQTGPDEEDNKHPSGNDRSEEDGKSDTQGKSQSDPDGDKNAYGGSSGYDKLGYDGGLDKGDQDGNNGCGNDDDFEDDNNGNCKGKNNDLLSHDPKGDHPGKNPGGCDANGSTGDKNGRSCDPGKNNASEQGCLNGEPDCDEKNEDPKEEPKEKEKEKETSHEENQTHISIVINVNNQVNNQQSTQPTASEVLAASTLAATGDSLFKLAVALILMGTSSLIFGLLFLFRKAINKVFNRGYQSYLYLYEA